jgi:hypothetical protein
LNDASLGAANLGAANLTGADLSDSAIEDTDLSGAKLAATILTGAYYGPVGTPPTSDVQGIIGLDTVRFGQGKETGMVQLRDLLQKAGLRDREREATFSIEYNETREMISDWQKGTRDSQGSIITVFVALYDHSNEIMEGIFRRVAFGWTVAFGLYPARALRIIATLWVCLIPFYFWYLRFASYRSAGAICRVWPKERLEKRGGTATSEVTSVVEVLHLPTAIAIRYAAYFSLLSAFHLGWRDLNVGAWIARIQTREFTLRPVGSVRVVSGLQSLISVYLLALWALSYFGRPFEQ